MGVGIPFFIFKLDGGNPILFVSDRCVEIVRNCSSLASCPQPDHGLGVSFTQFLRKQKQDLIFTCGEADRSSRGKLSEFFWSLLDGSS